MWRKLKSKMCVCTHQQQHENDLEELNERRESGSVSVNDLQSITLDSRVKDFNKEGDDVREKSVKEIKAMSYGQIYLKNIRDSNRMEHKFPFYRMDVNGYMMRIKEALTKELEKQTDVTEILKLESMTLESLQVAFEMHDSWKDLKNLDSEFVKFLNEFCGIEGQQNVFKPNKLRILGLLWCEGNPQEKVTELYDCLQDAHQPKISATDKDFKPHFFEILDIATECVFQHEPVHMGTGEPFSAVSKETIQGVKDAMYEDIAETFIDEIFGYESTLERKKWEELVVKQQGWIFKPRDIREKLGYPIE